MQFKYDLRNAVHNEDSSKVLVTFEETENKSSQNDLHHVVGSRKTLEHGCSDASWQPAIHAREHHLGSFLHSLVPTGFPPSPLLVLRGH